MRRIPLVLVALLALALVAGCGGGGGDAESGEPAAAPGGDAESVETRLQDDYGDAEWFAGVSHIASVMKLRHPVWEVHFDATVGDVRENDWTNEVLAAFGGLGLDGYWVDVYGTDGAAGGGGSGSGESVTLPAAPGSVDGMAAWMDEAYGPGSGDAVEDWYGHITGYVIDPGAWSGGDVLVVQTDLVVERDESFSIPWGPEKQWIDLIKQATASANVTWATGHQVVDANGENLSMGDYRPDMVTYQGY